MDVGQPLEYVSPRSVLEIHADERVLRGAGLNNTGVEFVDVWGIEDADKAEDIGADHVEGLRLSLLQGLRSPVPL